MIRLIFTVVSLFFFQNSYSQTFSWVKTMGGNVGDDAVRASYVDTGGNVYVTGSFFNTIEFIPGGAATFVSVGGADVFVAKYDLSGNFAWARTFGGTGTGAAATLDDYGYAIQTDASGNVYVTGFFQNTVDFNPANPGLNVLTSQGLGDMFIVKYDASGNFQWVKQIGGANQQIGYGMRLDAAGNIFISGAFVGAADFDPDPVTTATLTGYSTGYDGFLAKYDNSGNYLWAHKFGSTSVNNADNFWNLDIDNMGNVYAVGYFAGTVDFNPGAGTNNISTVSATLDVIVAKYDNNGNYIWAKNMGGSAAEYGRSIKVDTSGHFYITGYFNGTVDFNPSGTTNNLVSAGLTDIFLAKYDTSGAYIWAKKLGGTGNDNGWNLDIDNGDGIYLTGYFSSATANFNPAGTANLANPGGGTTTSATADGFLAKYDTAGNYQWAHRIGSTISLNDYAYAVNVDPVSGRIFSGGGFSATTDFDFDAPLQDRTANGGFDIFLAQYSQTSFPLSVVMSPLTGKWAGDIAVLSWTTYNEIANKQFEVERSADGRSFTVIGQIAGQRSSLNALPYEFKDSAPVAGLNYYRIKATDLNGRAQYSNMVLLNRAAAVISAYPNPVKDVLYINTDKEQAGTLTVLVLNTKGQLVYRQEFDDSYASPYEINTGSLPAGVYILHAGRGVSEMQMQFVK